MPQAWKRPDLAMRNKQNKIKLINRLLQSRSIDIHTGCWKWTKGKGKDGYGKIKFEGKTFRVHRLIYNMMAGDFCTDLCICHTCDNPPCFNPFHLWKGTVLENEQDKDRKKRRRIGRRLPLKGVKNPRAKFTDEEVIAIIHDPRTSKAISKEKGVSPSTIERMRNGEGWSHISALTGLPPKRVPLFSMSKEQLEQCRAVGMHTKTVASRMRRGWSFERAISTPVYLQNGGRKRKTHFDAAGFTTERGWMPPIK